MDKRFLARLECCPMKYLLTLLIVLLIPTAALAKGECKEEKEKFCAGLDKKEARACLRKHEAELGAACKTKIEARAQGKEEHAMGKAGDSSAASSADANHSLPATDTQPQPTYPDGKPQ
jgi:hypothetical protein